ADPHEVARLVLRERRGGVRRGLEHRRALFTDRQTSDCIAVEVELDEVLGRERAQLAVEASLRDCEAQLTGSAREIALPLGPQGRPADGNLELRARDAGGRADVEAHRDVRAEVRLDSCGELRREARRRTVV